MKRAIITLLLAALLLSVCGVSEETVLFGSFYQSAGTGAAEPLEWLVLQEDDKTMLLISRYIIDTRRLHDSFTPTCWEDCALRAWLNDGFRTTAFTDEERERLVPYLCEPHALLYFEDVPQGEAVTDLVFLLSAEEASDLLAGTPAACAALTDWARQNSRSGPDARISWWLRTVSLEGKSGTAVTPEGEIAYIAADVNDGLMGVRPCILIEKN